MPQEAMQTAVVRARKDVPSYRTTIPATYVNLLKLKEGDSLDWDHEIVNNEIIIKLRKVKGK